MAQIDSLFVTRLYRAPLSEHGPAIDPRELEASCYSIAQDDEAGHVAAFAEDLEFDLDGRALKLEDLWINILPEGGTHSSHLHPHSVISGTTYVSMPDGASALKLEDPRSARMMAAPARRKGARRELQTFTYEKPSVGDVLLWESWLRHEVPMNMSEDDRISVSFNYAWS